MDNEGIVHVLEQLGLAHKQALVVITTQAARIAELEDAVASRVS